MKNVNVVDLKKLLEKLQESVDIFDEDIISNHEHFSNNDEIYSIDMHLRMSIQDVEFLIKVQESKIK